jgi:hypothetical protein
VAPHSTVNRRPHAARGPWRFARVAPRARHPHAAIASIGARAIAFQRSVAVVLADPSGVVAKLAGHEQAAF